MVITAAAVGVLAVGAVPASAHVTVNPKEAPKGGYAVVSFRVPNEDDNAATNKLEVVLDPADVIPNARIKPVPGWEAQVTSRKLAQPVKTDDGEISEAVDRITWTAKGDAKIAPGQFQEFDVSFGPLPTAPKVTFKALQTYDNGNVVRWIDTNPKADHPAPVLTLTDANSDKLSDNAGKSDNDSGEGKSLAIGSLAVSVVALLVAVAAVLWARRAKASRTDVPSEKSRGE
ncbi:MAG: YcnI family protein [Mycobacteriales bacterium]